MTDEDHVWRWENQLLKTAEARRLTSRELRREAERWVRAEEEYERGEVRRMYGRD